MLTGETEMRRIVATTFTSLDGVMLGGWTAPHFDAALGASMGEVFGRPFDLLLGRKTYEIFAAHWPYVSDPNDPIASLFNRVTKYVAHARSRSWPGITAGCWVTMSSRRSRN
jgi:dihydrofolate reductase